MQPSPLSHVIAFAAVAACSTICTPPSAAAPTVADATRLFAEARTICERDHGKLWGESLCGPILLVDYTDQAVLANHADDGGHLTPDGALFRGVLPEDVIIADTPTEWSGVRWTQIVGPVPEEAARRHVLMAHELFHRIQPTLRLTRPEAGNGHLDTFDGRYLMQLEWRALIRALEATTASQRRHAIGDALAFRHARYRLFAHAAEDEGDLEINEGIAEYTGVRLGLTTDRNRFAYALRDLSAFVSAPTFVRSFAYATGPAYGLLLDRADPGWRKKIGDQRFDQLLSVALKLHASTDESIPSPSQAQTALYDPDGALRARETKRDEDRRARVAAFKARLVDGPVLSLPLDRSNYQFNPQTLVPLEHFGTIYPTMRLSDDWGSLSVDHGGALVRGAQHLATVSAVGADPSGLSGDGWQLKLNVGWKVRPGDRAGDLAVVREQDASK